MHTTLNEIRKYEPCQSGWKKLLIYLGKTNSDDDPLAFTTILDGNGPLDAIWCLRVLPDYDLKVMEFKLKCARRVEHLDKSGSAKKCLDVVEKFIKGEASIEDLRTANDAARDAAYAAARDAADAAYAAARDAADAANAAANAADAAYAAARDAADAAYAAAYAAADAAADAAAYAAARDAAYAAARDAAYAAARDAAYAAARDAEREYQTEIFREIFS